MLAEIFILRLEAIARVAALEEREDRKASRVLGIVFGPRKVFRT
jgi:hypothetical protein